MKETERLIARWQSAGILDAAAAERIRAYEADQNKPSGLRWEVLVALILGGLLLACGVVLFVSAHWDEMGPGSRLTLVMAMVAVFHAAGALTRERFHGLSTTLHAVGTVATGAAIALVGQIFNIEEHWPAAILMWALAAFAGWALLRDQAQQILALLLFPAWMLSELSFYTDRHIGQMPYIGRFLFVWAILYITFLIGSQRYATRWILFAVGVAAALAGAPMMLYGWESWRNDSPIPFSTRVWAWAIIAVVPLLIAAFKGHKGLIPPAAATAFVIALPWCQRIWQEYWTEPNGVRHYYTRNEPNVASHALIAAFAIFLTWWGVRQASRALVNLGMIGFAITVCWFYFGDLFDKMGRSLGLIGLGILFLLGGWGLEKMRRRLIAGMAAPQMEAL